MTRVVVNPKVLEWAWNRSGEQRIEPARRFPRLARWLAGEESPTLSQLKQFSKATATPLGFLFLQKPPVEQLPIPHYRTVDDKAVAAPSPELLDTLYTMQRRQAWLREYLVEEARGRIPLVKSARQNEPATAVADKLRTLLGLNMNWASQHATWTDALRMLREVMGQVGIIVVVNGVVGNNTRRPLDVEEFRGFVLADDYAPLVFVNGADAKSAQMFTLAHELAHVAFGSSAAFDLRQMLPAKDPTELSCNRVAAEFLVPGALLLEAWKPNDPNPYETIARAFKVSKIVAARRLLDLQLITREAFFAFYRANMAEERKHKSAVESGGDFYATAPQRVGARFAIELLRALREGRVLHTEAYRLTGMNGKAFEEFAKRAQEGRIH